MALLETLIAIAADHRLARIAKCREPLDTRTNHIRTSHHEPVAAGMGKLLSVRYVQGNLQRHRQPRLAATGRIDPSQTPPDQPQPAPTPLLRPGLADRPRRGRVHRRLHAPRAG